MGPTDSPDNVEKGNKSLALARYRTNYMTTISQVLLTTDRTTSDMLVPRYIYLSTRCQITQHNLHGDFDRTSSLALFYRIRISVFFF